MGKSQYYGKGDLFSGLVRHHVGYNLPLANERGYLRNGRLRDPSGREVVEGRYEIPVYDGVGAIADGDRSIDALVKAGLISILRIRDSTPIANDDDLTERLRRKGESKDGGAILSRGIWTRVGLIEPHVDLINALGEEKFYDLFPHDFVSSDGRVPVQDNIGTRTIAVAMAPQADSRVRGYEIKNTAWGKVGFSKTVEFDGGGVRQEFALMPASARGPCLYRFNKVYGVVGLHRVYERRGGKLEVAHQNPNVTNLDELDNYSKSRNVVYSPKEKVLSERVAIAAAD